MLIVIGQLFFKKNQANWVTLFEMNATSPFKENGSFPFRVGKSFLLLNCYIGIHGFKIQVASYQENYDPEVPKRSETSCLGFGCLNNGIKAL